MAQKKIGFTKGSAQADRLILNNGLTATTQISFSGASSLTFSLPQTNGASGQVIVTDGAGNLSFAAAVPGVSGFAFGSAATPSIFFTNDADTGLFRSGTNQLGFSTGGTQKLLIGTSTIQSDAIHVMSSDLRLKSGTIDSPSVRFATDLDTGIFRPLPNTMAMITGGATAAIFEAGGIRFDQAVSGVPRIKFGGTSSTTGIFNAFGTEISIRNNDVQAVVFSSGRSFFNSANHNTAASPSLSFLSDLDTGIFRPAADQLSISCGGATAAIFDSNAVRFVDGSSATPSLSFQNDSDTGIFRPGTDQLSISTGGTQRLLIGTTTIQSDLSFRIANGTLADPSLRFTGTNAGFFRPRTSGGILINNAIAVACGGLTASMFDTATGANQTRLLLFDVTANTLVRVSRGPADSGGTGSRALIIPN